MNDVTGHSRSEDDPAKVDLSIVVPVYNEEEAIDAFFVRVIPVAQSVTSDYEIVCVDDGSTDSTLLRLIEQRVRNPRIKVISFSRNFGKDVALSAGLDHAKGQSVVPIDCDLQDPPELIPTMYARMREGYDVVLAKRADRESDTFLKRLSARMFYRLHNTVADVSIPFDTGDFRMIDRKVIEALKELPERVRFMKGIFAWVGFKQASVEYNRAARSAGATKWKYLKLWNFALDGIIADSTLPLRIWTYLGAIVAIFAFVYAATLVIRTMLFGVEVPGYASMISVILFLGGINVIATGILGEYLGRVYTEVRHRPLYIVRETHGINPQPDDQDTWNEKSTTALTSSRIATGGSARAAKSSGRR